MSSSQPELRVSSALSTITSAGRAAREAARRAVDELAADVDLAFAFFSLHHSSDVEDLVAALLTELGPGKLVACSTQTPIAEGREMEDGPAVALLAAALPGASITPFAMAVQETADGPALVGFPIPGSDAAAVILLADPFTFPVQPMLAGINADHPGLAILGGLASGGGPAETLLVLEDSVRNFGAVGAVLGGIEVEAIVSQGCKPIGDDFVITACEDNVLLELGGRPPLERLRSILASLPAADQARVQGGLLLGILMDESRPEPGAGDYLVRSFRAHLGAGALEVGDRIELGQRVRFHLRDRDAADAELRYLLSRCKPASGALMFSCNGRGQGMFGVADHDARLLDEAIGAPPTAGMFCQGEIGPVGGTNYLHGFTASIALIR